MEQTGCPFLWCISLGDIRYAPTRWVLALFLGFVNFWSNVPKFRPFWGGMCILFEICEKGPFQKCMGLGWGWGVDGHIFEQTELQIGQCTRRSNARGTTDYSESESSSLLPPSTRAETVHAGRFSPNQHQCMWPRTHAVKPSGVHFTIPKLACKRSGLCSGQNPVFLVGACRLLRTGCTRPFCWARRCTPANLHPLSTPRAYSFANQRFVGCIWGGNSPWSEFICGHVGCLLTKEAASNTGTVQNGRKSQTYCQYSMQTQGVPNSPFQGFSEYTPHTPTYGTPSGLK